MKTVKIFGLALLAYAVGIIMSAVNFPGKIATKTTSSSNVLAKGYNCNMCAKA